MIETCFYIFFIWSLGKPFNTTQPVNYSVSNVISAIIYGSRFDYADPAFQKMVDRNEEIIHLCGSAEILVLVLLSKYILVDILSFVILPVQVLSLGHQKWHSW